ncbi:uncharacterized protein LOC134252736 [Saccostrea cucullata]|uniref:uncharacterized protein LOC134252736 n=1 Tax=Saccostrea cuccullata TaxID=36930 RepID=UPI002ED08F2D
MGSGSSAQCKARQCSQCQGDTEFYCNTCKHDLCLQCKEIYVIDQDTIFHDVVIYREKYKYIPNQETCLSHPNRMYNKYCCSCRLPLCSKCETHKRHEILDIRKAYTTNREQHRHIIHRIRSEILYKNKFLLADIKTDLKAIKTEILKLKLKISTKAQRLIDLTVTERIAVNVMINKLQQQKRKRNRQLASIENLDHRYEHSTNRTLKFLYFIKNMNVPKIKDTCNFTPLSLLSMTEEIEINMGDLVEFLSKIQIIERGQRRVRDMLELMSTPVIVRNVQLKIPGHVMHISRLTSEWFWISHWHNHMTEIILTNIKGDILHRLVRIANLKRNTLYGSHTVNSKGELIYIGSNDLIYKVATDNRMKSILLKGTNLWKPLCVHSSPINGELLVGMFSYVEKTGKVNRYNDIRQHIQTIQHDNKGQQLYSLPLYITENRNGDVIVSDYDRSAVVVTDGEGRHRFSYTGPPLKPRLNPRGICTDTMSHILVCDLYTDTVQIIDRDGHFLSQIPTQGRGIYTPHGLSFDNKTHLLRVGTWDNTVCLYRYVWINSSIRHDFSTRLILTNKDGYTLDLMINKHFSIWYSVNGEHTVNNKGELIYIVHKNEIYKPSTNDRSRARYTLIKRTDPWQPQCVYSSPTNGDLLVGMFIYAEVTCKVNRYNKRGHIIQTIQHDNTGQQMYSYPRYITENCNGDVIVSDLRQVVVTDGRGGHRFSYTGPPLEPRFSPWGICTDALSHILVCDRYTNSVQMIDKDGNFLSKILTQEQGIFRPLSLGYDKISHLLWVGSRDKRVCAYRYLKKKYLRQKRKIIKLLMLKKQSIPNESIPKKMNVNV